MQFEYYQSVWFIERSRSLGIEHMLMVMKGRNGSDSFDCMNTIRLGLFELLVEGVFEDDSLVLFAINYNDFVPVLVYRIGFK